MIKAASVFAIVLGTSFFAQAQSSMPAKSQIFFEALKEKAREQSEILIPTKSSFSEPIKLAQKSFEDAGFVQKDIPQLTYISNNGTEKRFILTVTFTRHHFTTRPQRRDQPAPVDIRRIVVTGYELGGAEEPSANEKIGNLYIDSILLDNGASE